MYMLDDMNEVKVLDWQDVAEYLSRTGVCSLEEAFEYLEAEADYYSEVGLAMELDTENFCTMPENPLTISEEEWISYIADHSSLSIERVSDISNSIMKYLDEKGFFIETGLERR